jgi:hypothetical protein
MRKYGQFFSNADLSIMQVAMDAACRDLSISRSEEDSIRRDRVALMITQVWQSGEHDPEIIRQRAVDAFKPAGSLGKT